ncbi:hypothetical protein SKAU_G00018260 [Synaphobranchus kaupii]|uniref:Uncharacterized protein n=1 Tax=Synaphobranchus kaupii TaxID=118154 RepID=A0A9Q1GCF8_SYNKA|nr:hypothetical protein SKAU_G00018260 [Synaphobranchus kaupii]
MRGGSGSGEVSHQARSAAWRAAPVGSLIDGMEPRRHGEAHLRSRKSVAGHDIICFELARRAQFPRSPRDGGLNLDAGNARHRRLIQAPHERASD